MTQTLSKKPHWENILWFCAIHLAAIYAVLYGVLYGYSDGNWILFAILYSYRVVGITIGYHRLITHNGFGANNILKFFFLIGGAFAIQGSAIVWATFHRMHHKFSDLPGDPHSPKEGFGWAHIGWLLFPYQYKKEDLTAITKDLKKSKLLVLQHKSHHILGFLGFIFPFFIFGWEGLLLCGTLCLVASYHMTFSVNSICHMPRGFFIRKFIRHIRLRRRLRIFLYIALSTLWLLGEFILLFGTQPKNTNDDSRNNWLLAIPTFGESLHNNHHDDPRCAYHGYKWWHPDPSKWILWASQILQFFTKLIHLRLVWDIKTPRKAPSAT